MGDPIEGFCPLLIHSLERGRDKRRRGVLTTTPATHTQRRQGNSQHFANMLHACMRRSRGEETSKFPINSPQAWAHHSSTQAEKLGFLVES